MADYSVALGVQSPQGFDASRAFSLAAQLKGQEFDQEQALRRQAFAEQQALHSQKNEDARLAMAQSEAAQRNSLLKLQLSQAQGGQNALAEYSKDPSAPGAVDKLSRYPEIQSQVLQVRSQLAGAEQQQFDQKLLRNGRRAQYVSGFTGDAKTQAWQDTLKDALAHGDISEQQYQQYSASEPNDLLLHNVMAQAMPIQDLYKEQQPTEAMRNLKAAGIEPTSDEGQAVLTGGKLLPKFDKMPDGRLIRTDPVSGETLDVTPAPNSFSKGIGGRLSDEAAQSIAERFVASGNRMEMANLGRGGVGDANRAKVQDNITALLKERGISPEEFANRQAEWEGRKALQRKLATQEASMMTAGAELEQLIPAARGVIEKLPRTSFLPFNKLLQLASTQTLNPDQAELATRTQAVVNAYASVINRGASVTTDSSRSHAEALLNTAGDAATYNRVLDTLTQEAELARKSPEKVREFYRQHYGARALETPPAAGGAAPPAAPVVKLAPRPPGATDEQIIANAQKAIQAGKDPAAVKQQLEAWGIPF